MLKTISELKALNIDLELDEFHDFIADVFANVSHGTYSVEDMLCRPEEAEHFGKMVQAHVKANFPDSHKVSVYIILKTILNIRKNGKASAAMIQKRINAKASNGRKKRAK